MSVEVRCAHMALTDVSDRDPATVGAGLDGDHDHGSPADGAHRPCDNTDGRPDCGTDCTAHETQIVVSDRGPTAISAGPNNVHEHDHVSPDDGAHCSTDDGTVYSPDDGTDCTTHVSTHGCPKQSRAYLHNDAAPTALDEPPAAATCQAGHGRTARGHPTASQGAHGRPHGRSCEPLHQQPQLRCRRVRDLSTSWKERPVPLRTPPPLATP